MELPKNITQIGESDARCKVYVEDYVISYIKQMNQLAENKRVVIALYGIRRDENDISYVFFYGACRITSIQKEIRHLSQAQNQEIEKLRKRYFPGYQFLGYRLLNGEMVEGFHICEQNACRYISGYACFYEKNDAMLAYMLESRKEEAVPEAVDQEKYERVKQRQQERRNQYRDSMTGSRRERSGFWTVAGKSGGIQPENESIRQEQNEEQMRQGDIRQGDIRQNDMQQDEKYGHEMTAERMDQSVNADQSGMDYGRTDQRGRDAGRASESGRADHTGRADRSGRAARAGRAGRSSRAARVGRADRTGRTDHSSRTGSRTTGTEPYKGRTAAASSSLKMMRAAVVGMFLLLCVLGILTWNGSGSMEDIQTAARQLITEFTEQKLPDSDENAADSQTNTLVTEDKLTDAIIQENEGHQPDLSGQESQQPEQESQPSSGQGEQDAQSQTLENSESATAQTGQPQESGQQTGQQPAGDQAGQQAADGQDDQNNQQTQQNDQQAAASADLPSTGQESQTQETQNQEPSVEASAPAVYVIKKGDTLTGISIRNYGTDEMVKEICELNHIEDPDDIRFGQKIILP